MAATSRLILPGYVARNPARCSRWEPYRAMIGTRRTKAGSSMTAWAIKHPQATSSARVEGGWLRRSGSQKGDGSKKPRRRLAAVDGQVRPLIKTCWPAPENHTGGVLTKGLIGRDYRGIQVVNPRYKNM